MQRPFFTRRCTFGDEIEQTREEVARYFNKEYCEASLTYLVTPSDYDKLTAAYFLPGNIQKRILLRFPYPQPFLQSLITDLIS